jgi:hypothetical protein
LGSVNYFLGFFKTRDKMAFCLGLEIAAWCKKRNQIGWFCQAYKTKGSSRLDPFTSSPNGRRFCLDVSFDQSDQCHDRNLVTRNEVNIATESEENASASEIQQAPQRKTKRTRRARTSRSQPRRRSPLAA